MDQAIERFGITFAAFESDLERRVGAKSRGPPSAEAGGANIQPSLTNQPAQRPLRPHLTRPLRGRLCPPALHVYDSASTADVRSNRKGQMQPQSEAFDAIVVGSGISGGWAAKELTERGLRVLMLERGTDVEHVKDYPNARKAPWEYPHRGGRTHAMEEAYPVLKRDYPLNEKNLDWWVNEKDSPYTEVKRFDWYRGYHVGGRSLTWGRQSYRLSDLDFEANAKEGIAIDWPIRYADLAPWYDHVERFAGVAGSAEGLPQLPDGQFQPAMPLNVRGGAGSPGAWRSSSAAAVGSFPAASPT